MRKEKINNKAQEETEIEEILDRVSGGDRSKLIPPHIWDIPSPATWDDVKELKDEIKALSDKLDLIIQKLLEK
jgi:type I restriction-modification system DNA methylase subunit